MAKIANSHNYKRELDGMSLTLMNRFPRDVTSTTDRGQA